VSTIGRTFSTIPRSKRRCRHRHPLVEPDALVECLKTWTDQDTGLHFTPEGYKKMYEAVIRVIRDELPELSPENLPFVFPPWVEALKQKL
jgi:hypothetical protein